MHVYVRMHVCVGICMHMCVGICVYARVCRHMCACAHVCVCAWVCAYKHVNVQNVYNCSPQTNLVSTLLALLA